MKISLLPMVLGIFWMPFVLPADEAPPPPFSPGRTLAEDLKGLEVKVGEEYLNGRPRLLFGPGDREAMLEKSREAPELWARVSRKGRGVISAGSPPGEEEIRSGSHYWRVERLQSASLTWFVTRDPALLEASVAWMKAYSREPVWGTGYRPNLDLAASWYLYHLSIAYDTFWPDMREEDRAEIRKGLADHARAIFEDHDPADTEKKFRYDQNHTYIPVVALTAASLALLDEVPEARSWLNRGTAILRRCRYVLGEDGYYYEGFGYWAYAMHWHVRGAELLSRATGMNWMDLPAIRETWRNGLYLSLPGFPGAFDLGDTVNWREPNTRPAVGMSNHPMLWAVAAATGSAESRTAGNFYQQRKPELDYPAAAFLWFQPGMEAKPLTEIPPYHYFPDHGVVSWRSGWGEDDTAVLFRCGPPLGHRAAEKLKEFDDWTMNCGHVHPDIGAFWLYAKGRYLAVDTGYLAEKWTRNHNTLLVDGKGQGVDGSYWNERGVPYAHFNHAKIEAQFLSEDYGFVRGNFGSAYTRQVPGVKIQRTLMMTKEWLLVVDDLSAAEAHTYSWLCHADAEFKKEGDVYIAEVEGASLAVFSLAPAALTAETGPEVVIGGTGPGRGAPQQRGFELKLTTTQAVRETRMIHLLMPLSRGQAVPEVTCSVDDRDRLHLTVRREGFPVQQTVLDLAWTSTKGDGPGGPARITRSEVP